MSAEIIAFKHNILCLMGNFFSRFIRTACVAANTDEDRERVRLLGIVAQSRDGIKQLTLDELVALQAMIERKDFSQSAKTRKSKRAILKQINVRIYELTEGRGIWGN